MNLILTGLLLLGLIALVIYVSRLPLHTPPPPTSPFDTHLSYWLEAAAIEGIDPSTPAFRIQHWANRIPDQTVRDQVLLRLIHHRRI